MTLNNEQQRLIIQLDSEVYKILSTGGDKELLIFLMSIIDSDLNTILTSSAEGELDKYCEEYQGFYRLIKLLENLAP